MLGPDLSDGALPGFEGWQTLEKLGEGGMCAVFRGRPDDGGPERAIKVLTDRSEASIRRFVDEARLLQRIDHPNVVRVHHIAPDARPPWLVMDLLGGRDLEETMKLEGPMGPERAARTFADLASGLAAVHAAGVRHRDIKPANIRLGTDGVPRLIDFGIARDAGAERVTKQGFVVGTASYLPPEIFTEEDANSVQDTEQADVYALGQTLCELLAGQPVHGAQKAGTEASLLVRIMRDKLDNEFLDPRDRGAPVPETLAFVVRRATARAPQDRFGSARALEEALRAWLRDREATGEVAPLTRMGTASLPSFQGPPPAPTDGPAPAAPSAADPRPAAPVRPATPPPAPSRAATPVPASRVARTAAVGAVASIGVGGIALVVVLVVALAVVGAGLLWYYRPGADTGPDAVRRVVDGAGAQLATCRPGGRGDLMVSLSVRDGRAERVDVIRSNVEKRTERCVERVLGGLAYPRVDPVVTEIPVHFR